MGLWSCWRDDDGVDGVRLHAQCGAAAISMAVMRRLCQPLVSFDKRHYGVGLWSCWREDDGEGEVCLLVLCGAATINTVVMRSLLACQAD